jgi:hypothetical protein
LVVVKSIRRPVCRRRIRARAGNGGDLGCRCARGSPRWGRREHIAPEIEPSLIDRITLLGPVHVLVNLSPQESVS